MATETEAKSKFYKNSQLNILIKPVWLAKHRNKLSESLLSRCSVKENANLIPISYKWGMGTVTVKVLIDGAGIKFTCKYLVLFYEILHPVHKTKKSIRIVDLTGAGAISEVVCRPTPFGYIIGFKSFL